MKGRARVRIGWRFFLFFRFFFLFCYTAAWYVDYRHWRQQTRARAPAGRRNHDGAMVVPWCHDGAMMAPWWHHHGQDSPYEKLFPEKMKPGWRRPKQVKRFSNNISDPMSVKFNFKTNKFVFNHWYQKCKKNKFSNFQKFYLWTPEKKLYRLFNGWKLTVRS